MVSPFFPQKRAFLEPLFTVPRLKKLWKDKVRAFQNRQPYFDIFENIDAYSDIDNYCTQICERVLEGSYRSSSKIRVAVEKSKGLCRHLSVPNAKDGLVLQALSDSLYHKLKAAEPSNSAYFEQKQIPFSQSDEYGTFQSWLKFQTAILGFTKSKKFIITTDIANFYDHIGHRHLRNIISSICNDVNESVLDVLVHTVSELLWHPEYMPNYEVALPQMDSDAPRILAHAFLYEADRFLENQNCEFARFMDDIDIGVDNIRDAKRILRDLDITLKSRGVRLNSGKTHILTSKEAESFFFTRENAAIDTATDSLSPLGKNTQKRLLFQILIKHFYKQYWMHKYSTGNGEKIIKRYITLHSRCGKMLPTRMANDLLKNRPGVRQNVLSNFKSIGLRMVALKAGLSNLEEGYWDDDASAVYFADYIVSSTFKQNHIFRGIINKVANHLLQHESQSRLMSGLWIASKFFTKRELHTWIKENKKKWAHSPDLGRMVGGLGLRFCTSKNEFTGFRRIILDTHNAEAVSAIRFIWKIRFSNNPLKGALPIMKASNPTLPNKISHAKALLVSAALKNPALSGVERAALSAHSFRSTDHCYKKL